MKKLISALLLCTSMTAMANSFEMSVVLQGKDIYQPSGAHLKGSSSVIYGSVNAHGVFDGNQINTGQAIPETTFPNDTQIIVKNMQTVQIINNEHGINSLAPAIITNESITVTADAIAEIYGASYLASAAELANRMDIQGDDGEKLEVGVDPEKGIVVSTDEVDVNFNLEISDLVCTQHLETQLIGCDSTVEITMGFVQK